MTYQDRTSTCAECKSSFEMVRLDQRFCRRKCRNTFNNRNHRTENQNTKSIDAILHSNRKILEELNSGTSTKEQLLKKGFNFRHITEVFAELPDIADEAEFDEQSRYAKLYKAVSKLPEQRQKVLELAVYESLSYQEIADTLHVSRNTVKTQISRAYRFLKETLEPRDFYFFCLLQKKWIESMLKYIWYN